MKHRQILLCSHICRWLIALLLLLGLAVMPAFAEQTPSATVDPLKPTDLTYENGNIILHKQGERIGPDEWKVTVKATVGEQPVEKRKVEVVMLVDLSSSMRTNEVEDHKHDDTCDDLDCDVHVHSENCYELICTETNHEHTYIHGSSNDCYKNSKCYAHNSDAAHEAAGCHKYGYNWYALDCDRHTHSYDAGCYKLTYEHEGVASHTHGGLGCYQCEYYGFKDVVNTNSYGNNDNEYILNGYATRLAVAAVAAERLLSSLPADSTTITRLGFNAKASKLITGIENYYDVSTNTGTYLWQAINLVLSGNYFSSDPNTKKVFVILNDGNANDSATNAIWTKINTFKETGTIFTVGFAQADKTLGDIAGGDGGKYMMATNAEQLIESFDELSDILTAMLEDPMGTTVGFDKTSIQEIQTSGGVISSNNDTIYWHPAEDGNSSINNSTIAYSYTVKLNEKAEMGVGEHLNVPLNNPTNFLYGIKGSDNVADMKSAAFPIPKAKYEISSIQTKWQYNGKDIQTPTEVEKIICDYASATYIPAFKKVDYTTITPVIPVPRSSDYYRYIGTTVTANNQQLPGVEAVDATKPVAYVVIHQYELVDSDEMVVGGTKTLIGRDFKSGDSFTFTLTADTANAPMPETDTVTIEPTSGTSMAFSFGKIIYTQAGTYTYTIKETPGNLTNVIYDTTEHKLVVTVTEVNREMVVSYTMDGVKNGALTVTNHLETGSLTVVKREVISHLAEHQEKEFGFVINVKDASNRPLNGEYSITLPNAATQSLTFTNGYAVLKLKAGESVVINGLPDGASYTVTEDAAGGFTATATGDRGTIVANQTQTATFKNEYTSKGSYQFRAKKTLEEATLQQGEFSFSVLNEAGTVVAQGTNNADGNVFLDELVFTHELLGTNKTITQTYTVMENIGTSASYIYDRTRYTVTLTIVDNGDGTLSVTDNLKETNTVLQFANQYISSQLVVNKMVTGNLGSKNRDFSFNLSMPAMAGKSVQISTDGGATYQSVTLNEQGQTNFTLRDGQSFSIYPVTGDYTVTETEAGSYSTTYAINQGTPVNGTQASGTVDANGSSVTFVNTLESSVPTGVRTSAASAIMGLCLALGLLATVFAGKRWSRCER